MDRCSLFGEWSVPTVVADRIRPKPDGTERCVEWHSFPTQTVGADRIRPQHKAPLRGACAGSTYSSTLQGVYAHPGACENPGLRADAIRPYRAYAFIRVLAKIRGCGRILSAPTRHMRSSGCLRKSGVAGGFYPPLQGVYAHPGACEKPGLRAAISRPYRADTLIRGLAKIRGCGRILAAPTGRMRSSGCLRKTGITGGY